MSSFVRQQTVWYFKRVVGRSFEILLDFWSLIRRICSQCCAYGVEQVKQALCVLLCLNAIKSRRGQFI
jgi:hypothetical protein